MQIGMKKITPGMIEILGEMKKGRIASAGYKALRA